MKITGNITDRSNAAITTTTTSILYWNYLASGYIGQHPLAGALEDESTLSRITRGIGILLKTGIKSDISDGNIKKNNVKGSIL